jgi:hypothetical protein
MKVDVFVTLWEGPVDHPTLRHSEWTRDVNWARPPDPITLAMLGKDPTDVQMALLESADVLYMRIQKNVNPNTGIMRAVLTSLGFDLYNSALAELNAFNFNQV